MQISSRSGSGWGASGDVSTSFLSVTVRDEKSKPMKKRWPSSSLGAERWFLCLALNGVLPFGLGCSSQKAEVAGPIDTWTRRETAVVLEGCDVSSSSTERHDPNGDGRAELVIVRANGRPVCQTSDLDADGRPDRVVYFDDQGRVRRIESDFDRDRSVDEIALYENGVVLEKHRVTTMDGKLDTWEFYEAGRLVRTERDENGDGIIDQWWEYPKPGCPLIHSDADGDGRPDPQTTLDYCRVTGYVPPEESAPRSPTTPTFEGTGPTRKEIVTVSDVPAEAAAEGEAGKETSEEAKP